MEEVVTGLETAAGLRPEVDKVDNTHVHTPPLNVPAATKPSTW
jgi:hypothetical protein